MIYNGKFLVGNCTVQAPGDLGDSRRLTDREVNVLGLPDEAQRNTSSGKNSGSSRDFRILVPPDLIFYISNLNASRLSNSNYKSAKSTGPCAFNVLCFTAIPILLRKQGVMTSETLLMSNRRAGNLTREVITL